MRVLSALLFVPLFATGCGGCGVPFTHEIEGSLRLPFGDVGGNCDASGTDTNENGTVVYEHTAVSASDPPLCGVHAAWEGTLLDMADTKEQVEEEMVKQGLEPGTVTITFTGVSFEVTDVAIRDSAGNDVTPPEVPAYDGTLNVEGTDNLIVIHHEAPGDVADPDVTVNESPELVDAVNSAYANGEVIPGTGEATAVLDLSTAGPLTDADEPALQIDFIVKIEASIGL
jgi:hypothetical protein